MEDIETIIIREPQWKGLRVGLDEKKLSKDVYIRIDYRTKDGELWDDNLYFLKAWEGLEYPSMFRKGVKLRMIPIADLGLVL